MRSRNLNTYPEAFWAVIEKAATSAECFEFPVEDWKAGASLQGKFYAFRGALARESIKLAMLHPNGHSERDRVDATLKFSQNVVCWLDKRVDPPVVKIMHRNQTPEALMFEAALKAKGVLTPDQEIEYSAKRVLEALEKEKDEGKRYG